MAALLPQYQRELDNQLEEIRKLLHKREINYIDTSYNNRKQFDIHASKTYYDLEGGVFPLERKRPFRNHVQITLEYFELAHYSVTSPPSSDLMWKQLAKEDTQKPVDEYIFRRIESRFYDYQNYFEECLENTSQNIQFSHFNSKLDLIKAIITYYQDLIVSEEQLHPFYRSYLEVDKEIADLYCQALIILLKEKIHYALPNEETIQAIPSSHKDTTSADRSPDIKFPNTRSYQIELTQFSFLLLFDLLKEQGVIFSDISKRNLAAAISLLTSFSRQNVEKNEIKSLEDFRAEIKRSEAIPSKDKFKYLKALKEVKELIGKIDRSLDNEINKLKSKKDL